MMAYLGLAEDAKTATYVHDGELPVDVESGNRS